MTELTEVWARGVSYLSVWRWDWCRSRAGPQAYRAVECGAGWRWSLRGHCHDYWERQRERESRSKTVSSSGDLTYNKATLHSETNHNNTEKWLTACTVLKGSLNILQNSWLFNYYKVSTCHKINDQPTQLEVINEATLTCDSAYLHL